MPESRDELARRLYVEDPCGDGTPLTTEERKAGVEEWDAGWVKPEDIADCFRRADEILAERADA